MRNAMHSQFWRAEGESVPVVPIPYRDVYSRDEASKLQAGLVPMSMDEKWFVLFEDSHLLFFRSWTGILIYRVRLESIPEGVAAAHAEVLDNPELYRRGSLDYEAKHLSFLVHRLLLGQDVPFPGKTG